MGPSVAGLRCFQKALPGACISSDSTYMWATAF